jgi:phosphohistidine phosphatase SixA
MPWIFKLLHFALQGLRPKCIIAALIIAVASGGFCASNDAMAGDAEVWQALDSPGHFAFIRHALAPGTGDPANFQIGKCETQRNLSDEGRAQARRIGQRFRATGITKARVYTSQWCRCKQTAELLELGPVTELPAINSFFRNNHLEDIQTRQLSKWLKKQKLDQPLVLVTHQVNITAFTSIFPASGEMVVIRRTDSGEFQTIGTIRFE